MINKVLLNQEVAELNRRTQYAIAYEAVNGALMAEFEKTERLAHLTATPEVIEESSQAKQALIRGLAKSWAMRKQVQERLQEIREILESMK